MSLTSVVRKLLETLITYHMVEFLVKHKLINTYQHRFLKARSCLTNILGPILFLIYINDLEDDISSKALKFADDTKVFRKVTNVTNKQSLHDDPDKLVKWSEKWQMLFNFKKCKCIHIGYGNMDEEYKMWVLY